ncbi:MAG: hypothetical protein Kow0010_21970 [Dehalococcoidia bacterium]
MGRAMSSHTVRLATPADARVLARLRYEFRTSVRSPAEDETSFLGRCTRWMEERLRPGSPWRCWVVEREGAIVGHLWLQRIEKIPNPVTEREYHGYITNVYVQPQARNAGAGAALMAAAMAWSEEHGIDSIILWPTERSRTLYGRFGFAVRDDLMEAILHEGRLDA